MKGPFMQGGILIIDGHPDPESYCAALSNAYLEGANDRKIDIIRIRDLEFDPNLRFGYRKRTQLEPDLIMCQNLIQNASHIVWVYPVWWGSVPAIMKGFLDRVLVPGFAFKKREGSLFWDKYLSGKSARLICTMDQPTWYYRLIYGCPSHRAMKNLTMQFIGIRRVRITAIGPIRLSTDTFRKSWLNKVRELGARGI